jgi:2-polyprenyl-3-methyl-5-hydroxy-6-metoxy-1,4-benzoquinol methylase
MKFNGCGLEIGGPSGYFRTTLPTYQDVVRLDNVVYSDHTIWGNYGERNLIDGKDVGETLICDATSLWDLCRRYDYILSSNVIEHIANPLLAVSQWYLKLKMLGLMVIVAPKKESNFDHKRNVTTMDHLIADFDKDVEETDLSHLDEILRLHDLSLDPPAGTHAQFRDRSLKNIENRCLHHHVFDKNLLIEILDYFDMQLIRTIETDIDYCVIGQRI